MFVLYPSFIENVGSVQYTLTLHNSKPSLVVPVGQASPRLSALATLPSLVLQISKLLLFPYAFPKLQDYIHNPAEKSTEKPTLCPGIRDGLAPIWNSF